MIESVRFLCICKIMILFSVCCNIVVHKKVFILHKAEALLSETACSSRTNLTTKATCYQVLNLIFRQILKMLINVTKVQGVSFACDFHTAQNL